MHTFLPVPLQISLKHRLKPSQAPFEAKSCSLPTHGMNTNRRFHPSALNADDAKSSRCEETSLSAQRLTLASSLAHSWEHTPSSVCTPQSAARTPRYHPNEGRNLGVLMESGTHLHLPLTPSAPVRAQRTSMILHVRLHKCCYTLF